MKRFLAVLLVAVMLLSVLPATSMAASYATVVGGWLRLRSAPNFSASTITSYYTGTQVEILGSSGGWYKVQTPDGRTGYMYGNYLRMGGSVPSEGTAYVTSYNGYGVRLRTGPGTGYRIIRTYAVGTPVTVLERGTYWSRISIGGTVGYMMSQFLHFGSDYPDDSNVLCYATIWSSNGYGVRLRTGPSKSYSKIGVYSVGTKVAVLQKGAVWDRIRVGSRVGWMMNEFLIYHENNEVTSVTLNNYMPVVGSVLTMQAVSPNTATVSYEWLVGGVVKSTNTTYTVDANDVGKTIQLRVTGTGSYKGTVTSAATNAVVSNTVLTGVTLNTIAPVVGDVMTATINPAGANVIYAWKVGGYQVSNAATYTVTANDVGKQIELIVTGTGVYSGTQSSGLTAAVTASRAVVDVVIRNDSNTTVGAAPSVGDKLTAVPSPAQATVTYQWYRDGAAISGATSASYTVATEDEGHKLSVAVAGTGSYTGASTSSQTAAVVVKAPVLGLIVPTFDEVVAGYEQPAAKALTIANTGSAAATIASVSSSDPTRFIINATGSTQIAAGATDTSWTIQPAANLAAGTYGATVTVTYDGGKTVSSTVSFVVKESAPAPVSELVIGNVAFDPLQEGYSVPAAKNFTASNTGSADKGSAPVVQPISITNDGGSTATVTRVYLSGTNADSFTVNDNGSTQIAVGGPDKSWTVQPKADLAPGTYTAQINVEYNNTASPAVATVALTVTESGTPSSAVLTMNSISVPQPADSLAPVELIIKNESDVEAVIESVKVSDETNFTTNYDGSTYIGARGEDKSWKVMLTAAPAENTYTTNAIVVYNSGAGTESKTVETTVTIQVTAAAQTGLSENQNANAVTGDVVDGMTPSDLQPVTDSNQQIPTDAGQQTYVDPAQQMSVEPVQETSVEPVQEPSAEPVQEPSVEPVQEPSVEPAQQSQTEPEPQAPVETVLTIQSSKSSIVKGKTLQLTALINDQAIAYEQDDTYPIQWTVSGAQAKGTTISTSGLLIVAADETASTLTVTATLKSDLNNFCSVNLKLKEAQTTETGETTSETMVNEDGTSDVGMEMLDMMFNP